MKLLKCFADNQMKINKNKYHLLVSNNEKSIIKVESFVIEKSSYEKVRGKNDDFELNFNKYLDSVIKM